MEGAGDGANDGNGEDGMGDGIFVGIEDGCADGSSDGSSVGIGVRSGCGRIHDITVRRRVVGSYSTGFATVAELKSFSAMLSKLDGASVGSEGGVLRVGLLCWPLEMD